MKRPSNSVSTAGNYLRKSCRPRPSRSECRDATDTSDVKQQFAKLVFSIYQNLYKLVSTFSGDSPLAAADAAAAAAAAAADRSYDDK